MLYNLTPSRELTQPWCESSPWCDSNQHAAYIPSRASAIAVLPYVFAGTHFTYPQRDGRLSQPPARFWVGIEPRTCCMTVRCSTNWAMPAGIAQYINTYIQIHTCLPACMHAFRHTYAYVHICKVWLHIYICIYVCRQTCISLYVCMLMYINIRMFIMNICMHACFDMYICYCKGTYIVWSDRFFLY